jgi:hypothetical protein
MNAKVHAAIYEGPTGDFTSIDWVELALAALDQAGVTPRDLMYALEASRRLGVTWTDILKSLEDR